MLNHSVSEGTFNGPRPVEAGMTDLELDPDYVRSLASQLREVAEATQWNDGPPAADESSFGAALVDATTALQRRAGILSAHLQALATDAKATADAAEEADDSLARSFAGMLQG